MQPTKTLEEIKQIFRDSIVVPNTRPTQQIFFCPVGLVGSGKSTIVKPISEQLGLVRISSDELREMLKNNGHTYDSVKQIGTQIIESFARRGLSIAFDMDCGNPLVKEQAEILAKELGAKLVFVHVTTPEEYIFEKFRKHPPTWLADNPQIMIDNYLAQKAKRLEEGTSFDFLYTFDTSKPDLPQQIQECVDRIRKI